MVMDTDNTPPAPPPTPPPARPNLITRTLVAPFNFYGRIPVENLVGAYACLPAPPGG